MSLYPLLLALLVALLLGLGGFTAKQLPLRRTARVAHGKESKAPARVRRDRFSAWGCSKASQADRGCQPVATSKSQLLHWALRVPTQPLLAMRGSIPAGALHKLVAVAQVHTWSHTTLSSNQTLPASAWPGMTVTRGGSAGKPSEHQHGRSQLRRPVSVRPSELSHRHECGNESLKPFHVNRLLHGNSL